MKQWRVWDALSPDENVWRAWKDCARGKRRRPDVAELYRDADRVVIGLARALRAGTWRHQPYRLIGVRDPKRRLVAAATVADRIVHHAILRVLAPCYNRRFIEHGYACLPGRGTHRALLAWLAHAQRLPYVLCLDVSRYFYEIEQSTLRGLVLRAFPEPQVAALVDEVMRSAGRGLPIGNLTSQWWGNVYLDGLDHYALRTLKVEAYQRYMDDIHVFGRSRSELLEAREAIAGWLRAERGLRLKDPAAVPTSTHAPRTVLGYRAQRGQLVIGDKARVRFRERLAAGRVNAASLQSTMALWMFGA